MWECSGASSSSALSNVTNEDITDTKHELDEEDNEACLWSIDDDSMFFAQALKHHSAGKGKSVFVTWNESYLLNFVFKSSIKTGATALTKVRISMPLYDGEMEEIANMLILEMNTLLYMKSGRVYYFSSVKSMHRIDWLTGVRCMTTCPQAQFSVIRLNYSGEDDCTIRSRTLSLNVYKDVPQLGKYTCDKHILRNSYDISFDVENIFNCDWSDETYTLLSLITDEINLEFLKDLVSIGNVFRPNNDEIVLENKQEVHIFTISGNIFILVGAMVDESILQTACSQLQEDYSIRLLNTYASNVLYIHIDCKEKLLIVLLQSGHLDIWYKSKQMFDSIFHHYYQMSTFLSYDYRPMENTFYFTTAEDIIQLRIIISDNADVDNECTTKEVRKLIGGMIACTWVENLQQLICLSFNNIFYRIRFTLPNESTNSEIKYENLNNLYALNTKHVKDLMNKAEIVNELIEKPKCLLEAIEKEFEKQQILAFGSKQGILKKQFQCHIEYHVYMPNTNCFEEECIQINTSRSSSCERRTVFCLIFLTLKNNKKEFLKTKLFNSTTWYLHISNQKQSLLLHITQELLDKSLCFIVETPLTNCNALPEFSLNLLSFLNHNANYICLKFELLLECNTKTYQNIFSSNVQRVTIIRNPIYDIEDLLKKFNSRKSKAMECCQNIYEFEHVLHITESALKNIMLKLGTKSSFNKNFKLYYLYQYLIDLKYDESKNILKISSQNPEAIYYVKLFFMHAEKPSIDLDICSTITDEVQKKIMNYQSSIENVSATLLGLPSEDVDADMCSMHLENLRKVYLKLRSEFCDILR